MGASTYLDGVLQYPFLTFSNTWTGTQTFNSVVIKGESVNLTSTSASTYTVVATDNVILATGGAGGIAVDLPLATGSGRKLLIIKVDSGAGAVTVTPNSTNPDTIEGSATKALTAQWNKCGLVDIAANLWTDLATGGI